MGVHIDTQKVRRGAEVVIHNGIANVLLMCA
jgi:hypothetical protein